MCSSPNRMSQIRFLRPLRYYSCKMCAYHALKKGSLHVSPPYLCPTPARLSKSALLSLIFGKLGWIPFITGSSRSSSAIIGFSPPASPRVRGRWMALSASSSPILSIGLWSTVGLGVVAGWPAGNPERDPPSPPCRPRTWRPRLLIRAVEAGDDAAAKDLTVMNDADFAAAKILITAEGGFTDSTFGSSTSPTTTPTSRHRRLQDRHPEHHRLPRQNRRQVESKVPLHHPLTSQLPPQAPPRLAPPCLHPHFSLTPLPTPPLYPRPLYPRPFLPCPFLPCPSRYAITTSIPATGKHSSIAHDMNREAAVYPPIGPASNRHAISG